MASGSINLSSNVSQANGRIDWQSTSYQSDNHSDVNAQVYVVLNGWGIQGTGAGQWKENGNTVNTFSPYINIAWGGTGTVQVYSKNGIRVNHDNNGDAAITLGCDMQFSFAGVSNIGGSGLCYMDHIPRYAKATISERSKTIDSISVNWSSDVATNYRRYSINGGNWIDANDTVASNNRSGYFTISDLEPNTTYKIKVRVRRSDSGLWSESNTITVTTYNFATITEAPDITIGENATIKYSNPSGALTEVSIEVKGSNIFPSTLTTGGTYTFVFTEQQINNIYSLIPNDTKLKVRYTISTLHNGVYYFNYLERTFSLNVENSLPEFTNQTTINYTDTNSKTTALTNSNNKFILNYSDLLVNILTGAEAKNKATINNYTITDGTSNVNISATGSAPYSGTIQKVRRKNIELFAIDSRGLSSKKTQSLQTVDYTVPIIDSSTNLKRVNGVGSSVNFIFSGKIWKKSFGKVTNSIKFFKYKKILATSNNWDSASWIEIPTSKYSINSNGEISNIENAILTDFTIGTAYRVKIRIEDELDSAEIVVSVSSGEPIMSWNKNKRLVGVGKIPDKALSVGSIDVLNTIKSNEVVTNKVIANNVLDFEVIEEW